jgi:pyruvate/2-oxoacid:ferredoxin oxidoreductase alpha subunit
MSNKVFVSGNEAVAIGVKLAKPNVIAHINHTTNHSSGKVG